jgi:quercetin dioxygenase-like cupin family protein
MRATSPKVLVLAIASTTLALAAGVALATPPNGETPTPLASGALIAPANVNAKVTGGSVGITTQGALDVLMLNITLAPGGTGGWHRHAGPHITVVKQGTLTIFDAECKRHQLSAGHAVISSGGAPEKDENKGTTPVTFDVTFLIPHGVKSPRIDQPAPAGCTA